MSELFLVRHAQASFGSENYDQLSELGFQQAHMLGRYFGQRGIRFDHLVAGEMCRHQQTLNGICEGLRLQNAPPYQTHPGLNEYPFEELIDAYTRLFPDDPLVQNLATQPSDKKAYYRLLRRVLTTWSENQLQAVTETWADFQQRVANARLMLHDLADSGGRVLVISSGGAISLFIGTVLALSTEKVFDLNLQMRNTSISNFYFNRSKISLASFNAVPHLDQPGQTNHITYG